MSFYLSLLIYVLSGLGTGILLFGGYQASKAILAVSKVQEKVDMVPIEHLSASVPGIDDATLRQLLRAIEMHERIVSVQKNLHAHSQLEKADIIEDITFKNEEDELDMRYTKPAMHQLIATLQVG